MNEKIHKLFADIYGTVLIVLVVLGFLSALFS